MREGWAVEKLGDVCTFENGDRGKNYPSKKMLQDTGIPFVNAGNLNHGQIDSGSLLCVSDKQFDLLSRGKFRKGDVLFCLRGSLGKFALVSEIDQGAIASSLVIIRPKTGLATSFLLLYLQSDLCRQMIDEYEGGTAQPNLSATDLKRFSIPVPPLPEQRRIVSILDEAFEGIAAAKANAEKNLENSKSVFDTWIDNVFDQSGDNWQQVKFGDVTKLKRGHNPPKSKFIYSPQKGYVRFWQIRDGTSEKNAVYVPDSPKLHRVTKTDILLVAYRHVGRCFRGVEGAFNVALCCISNSNEEVLNSDFLYHMIPTKVVRGELLKRSERSLIPSMSVKHLAEIPIPLPPIKEQIKTSKQIKEHKAESDKLILTFKRKLIAFDELKKSLLHQAFNGDL